VTAHHLLKEEELLEKCLYCGKAAVANDWSTTLHLRKHYKEMRCSCGRSQSVSVRLQGSGHDDWVARTIKLDNLETKVVQNEGHK
jgi:hypothetical protein